MEFQDLLGTLIDSVLGKKSESQEQLPDLVEGKAPIALKQLPNEQINSPKLQYYPSNRHILKAQAPETILTEYDLSALAKAQKLAVSKGILSPDLGAKLLPMAMVEGHSGNYGIAPNLGLHPSPKTIKKMEALGLTVADTRNNGVRSPKVSADLEIRNYVKKDGTRIPTLTTGSITGAEAMARLAAAILSVKAEGKDVDSPEKAVERYNGKGKATELVDGKAVPADSQRYVEKVQEAQSVLKHPKNKAVYDAYLRLLGQ